MEEHEARALGELGALCDREAARQDAERAQATPLVAARLGPPAAESFSCARSPAPRSAIMPTKQ